MRSSNEVWICDFCGKTQHVANTIVTGERDVAICDECIDLCNEILEEKRRETKSRSIMATLKEKAKALRGG